MKKKENHRHFAVVFLLKEKTQMIDRYKPTNNFMTMLSLAGFPERGNYVIPNINTFMCCCYIMYIV